MFFEKNNQKGASLVEVLGVLTIISLIGTATLKLVTNSYGLFKQSMVTSEITELQKIISGNYCFSGEYEIDDTPANFYKKICEKDKTAPNQMCLKSGGSYVLKHRLGGNVKIEKKENSGYSIEFENINRRACVSLSQIDWLQRRKTNIYQLDINNVAVAYYPKKGNKSFPLTVNNSITGCNKDINTIKWYFY